MNTIAKTKTADYRLLKSKSIKVILALVTLLCMTFAMTISANAAGTFDYEVLEDGSVKIVSYVGDDTDVTVPAALSSGEEVSMLENTFNGNSAVKEITVSDGISTIGEYTFANCESLEYVTILSNSIDIDSTAFENSSAVINCYSGSSAEAYAVENNISYQILPESVALGKTSLTLGIGETYTLKTQLTPSNASNIMTWTSSNTSVATVDSNGTITANSNGVSIIRVKLANGETASCTLTVKKMATSVTLNKTSITLGVGETYDLKSTIPSGTAAYYRIYTSNSTSVATVAKSGGLITAKKAGTTTITCTLSNGKTATCKVTVKKMASKVTLNKTSITLGVGETYDLKSTIPSGTAAYYRLYSSNSSSVASVVKTSGVITAKKAGTATITCTLSNGKTATCKVTVKKMASKVTLKKTSITLGIGETYDLNSTIPSGTAAYYRLYSSSKTSVASVVKTSGVITAKKAGTTTITCTLSNGKTATCKVTVKKMATSVTLNKTSITLGVGETYDLNSSVPSGTAAYYRAYTSNATSVATVNKSGGLITAKKIGTATITCKLSNGKKATCKITVKKMATSVTLNSTSRTMLVGETFDLNSSIPSGTVAYYRIYTSSNTSVATVKKSGGLITAKGAGTATITCTLSNGKKATCKVTVVSSSTKKTTTASTTLRSGTSWSSSTITSVPKGSTVYYYASSGNWRRVKYGSYYGWIYNKAFGVSQNYSTINTTTLPTVVDDILFDTGTSLKSMFNYVYSKSYRSVSNDSIENLCVYILKYGRGACYHHAALLYYMMDRAGYEALVIRDGIGDYNGGGPHNWCMVKVDGKWRHIDPTSNTKLDVFYLVKDSVIAPYFSWDRTKYPAAN